jgi:hypothetical protein
LTARRTPWAVVVAAVAAAVVAAGAIAGAVWVREHRVDASPGVADPPSTTSAPVTAGACKVEPCRGLAVAKVAGYTVELVADAGSRSGRLRITGPSADETIELTVTDLGVTLSESSLQCVARALSACIVLGAYEDGVAGQVVVGRSGKWNSLTKPFVSSAGYLALAEVAGSSSGPEVIAAQYACTRASVAECAGAPVFAQVFAIASGTEVGCTGEYDDAGSLPGYPRVMLREGDLSNC